MARSGTRSPCASRSHCQGRRVPRIWGPILPVRWAPIPASVKLPREVGKPQFFTPTNTSKQPGLVKSYEEDGVYHLLEDDENAARTIVWQLAKRIQDIYYSQRLLPRVFKQGDLRDVFESGDAMTVSLDIPAPYFFLSYAPSDPLAGNPEEDPEQAGGDVLRRSVGRGQASRLGRGRGRRVLRPEDSPGRGLEAVHHPGTERGSGIRPALLGRIPEELLAGAGAHLLHQAGRGGRGPESDRPAGAGAVGAAGGSQVSARAARGSGPASPSPTTPTTACVRC